MPVRTSGDLPGKALHRQPIPTYCRVGNMIFSSAISGIDRETGEASEDAETQIGMAFANMKAAVEQAGGTTENIAKLTVYMADRNQRDLINKFWLETFPDENSRPVRHAIGGPLGGGFMVQLEFVAVV